MSERLPGTYSPLTGRTVAILVAVALLSLGAVLTLMAWSPDLSARDRAGPTPYSRSSTGYAGLIEMLDASGHTVSVSRLPQSIKTNDNERLLIVTLPLYGPTFDLDEIAGPALIVLPKWGILANPGKQAWELDASLADRDAVSAMLGLVDETASLWRLRNPGTISTPAGEVRPDFEHEMQVIKSNMLEDVIAVPGGTLLAKLPDREIYVLAEPDFINNFGLSRIENAKTGLSIVALASGQPDQSITFDATLHGFQRSTNLLKILLDIPYIGATFIALATMLLIGWAAAIRFGAPEREVRALAAGKQALADNSAGLIAMAKRERRMAPGYLSLSRRALSRELGLPKTLSEAEYTALLDRMGKRAGLELAFSNMNEALSAPATSREDLKHKARAIWRWRKEMTHGH